MFRFVFMFFLVVFGCQAFGRHGDVLHAKYADKFVLIDSLSKTIGNRESKITAGELSKLEAWARENKDPELEGEMKLLRIRKGVWLNTIAFAEAEKMLGQLLEDARYKKLQYLEVDALQALGQLYYENQHQAAGFEHLLSANVIYTKYSREEFPRKDQYLFELGSAYYRYGDNDNALRYIKESVTAPDFNLKKNFTRYNTLGLCYRNMGKYDSAEWFFWAIYDTAIANNDTVWSGITMGNIGITYYHQKKYDAAIPLLEADITTSINHHVIKNAVGSMLILGTIYFEQGKLDQAEQLLRRALDLCQQRHFWFDYSLKERIFKQLFKIYAAKHETGMATIYADSAMVAKDSNTAKNNALIFAKLQEKVELVQHQLASKQLQIQRKINFYLGLVSILLFGIGILAYLSQRRTGQLNRQITAQKQEVEQLNEVKDRIFSVISHDMRTPVNSLIAFTQLLESGNISPEKMTLYAATLRNNLGYTARLMENLLSWARTQMDGFKPVAERFDLAATASQAIGILQQEAEKKGITIENQVAGPAIVYADINMTALVVRNLLSNALKYTTSGGSVIISAERLERVLKVYIRDAGVGFTPELVTRFNDAKARQPIESTPGTNQEKGTGLGLMLCKTFIALMNGTITLESGPGKGSTFIVEMPLG